MTRYKIKIEYDGTPFVGWQFQKNGLSVQKIIQDAIFSFSQQKVNVTGAGRTDSGVHALTQVAHFDLDRKIKKKNFLMGVNQYIGSKPVTILNIKKVKKKFHARFDAKKRVYEYMKSIRKKYEETPDTELFENIFNKWRCINED